MWFSYVSIFILTCLVNIPVQCNLNHPLKRRLQTWHTLKQSDLYLHRHKRSITDDDDVVVPLDKQVSFEAFNQTFTLSLMPSPEILTPTFKAYSRSVNGVQELSVDKTSILSGTVMGDPHSHVIAHYDGKSLTANIETQTDTYVVEPMWRHLPRSHESTSGEESQHHDPTDMVVYRQSDVNLLDYHDPHSKSGFCQTKDLMASLWREQNKQKIEKKLRGEERSSKHHRSKRSSGNKKICKLALVADYRFYREMGNNSTLETMYYLISLIERVNKIYKNTEWASHSEPGKYSGYGFQINRIEIHPDPEPTTSSKNRYNQKKEKPDWDARDLLEAFSETNYSECLSHLFTYIDFPKGLLGLAYVGSSREGDVGGICTKSFISGSGKTLYLNTGLTSTLNWGDRILTTEADLVTAHELGHNFGADHDDDTETLIGTDCTPGQARGGNYIMYPAAVSGQYKNNNKFSACSKHAILPTLLKKAELCFEEESQSFCGNYKVDSGESCDVGLFFSNDRCCFSQNCTLKPGARCSNKNSPCCTEDCQVADKTKLCRAQIPGLCHKETYCNGKDFDCPPEKAVKDGITCGDMGKCKNGTCEQFCTTKGLLPCLCSEPKDKQCVRCCASQNASQNLMDTCVPYLEDGDSIPLNENAPCVLGYCSEGVCHKHTQDVIERVWNIFQYIAPDKIGEFLADNIVGAVLVFSLLFWIPCSCLVNFVDKKRLKARQKEEKWYSERGAEFARSYNTFRAVGSIPTTPRIRIQRAPNAHWHNTAVINSGLNAHEQWRASQERGIAMKKSRENIHHRLDAVPGSPNDDVVLSQSQPSLINLPANGNNNRPVLLSGSHSRSHPSLVSPLSSSLSDKSFDGEIKPIAVSSNTNLPDLFDEDSPVAPSRTAGPLRRSLKRQGAVISP